MKFVVFQNLNTDTEMDDNGFINSIKNGLKEGNTTHVLSVFRKKEHEYEIQNSSWDLIPVICEYLTENKKVDKPDVHACCDKLINIVADKANPEECILQMIEEVEEAKDDTAFVTLLKPLQKVLLRIKTKRQNSLAWCLNAIKTYIEKLETPESQNLEGNEKMLIETDPLVDRITRLYLDLLPFYDVFIEDSNNMEQERRMILCKFLIQLLGKPLAYLEMEYDGKTKSRARRIAESLCEKIMKVLVDPISIVEMESETDENVICKTSHFAQAVLFYLIFSERLFIEKVPKVYDAIYIFQTYLYLIPALCCESHQSLTSKALKLSDAFVKSVKGFDLSYQLLDSESHSRFFKALSNIIIFNPLENNRKFALAVLKEYLDTFETQGKYLLIYNIVNTVNHTSLIGYMITYYKDMLNVALSAEKDGISKYFCGQKLFNLLQLFCYLHKREESDMIELADQIIASLNLLRYLAIRDKSNVTKIWNFFPKLNETFLKPLKKGLMLSRAHYDLKINDLKQEMKTEPQSNVSVSVGGQNLPEMPPTEKLIVLNSAVTAFDVMESLLARLVELIESR